MRQAPSLPSFSFSKMQALGNDFVVIDLRDPQNTAIGEFLHASVQAAADACTWISDRRLGLGADQVLTVSHANAASGEAGDATVRMEIWNSDGSRAEMCGNGIRAVALLTGEERIETRAGVKTATRVGTAGWRVAMGVPTAHAGSERLQLTDAPEDGVDLWVVSMGNPHAVVFVEDVLQLSADEFAGLGCAVEMHPRFAPERTNVEFVQVLSPARLAVRVWERGAGATLACGTGACAAVVAAVLSARIDSDRAVEVILPGGPLTIEWAGPGQEVWMTGAAHLVAQGRWAATGPYWTVD